MKLKTVVASMVVLGGLSSPVFAAPYDINASCGSACNAANYQQDTSLVPSLDFYFNKNQPGGIYQSGWSDRIFLSGRLNIDAYLASKPPIFTNFAGQQVTGRASDLVLNNGNLFFDAKVNNWVTANLSIVYSSLVGVSGASGPYEIPNSLFVRRPVPSNNLDTAYVTIANPASSPVYFRIGKEYVPFGQYDPYGFLNDNPTQLFTETNAAVAQLGVVVPNGFYGSVYVFTGNPRFADQGDTRRIQNGGLDVGYGFSSCDIKTRFDIGYLANIADSNLLSSYYTNYLVGTGVGTTTTPGLPNKKVPAYDIDADITAGAFDFNGHFITTTRSVSDPFHPLGNGRYAHLGKPRVWGLEAGFTFPVSDHQSRVAIGYQGTTHLVNLLEKSRLYVDYIVNMAEWFDLGFAISRDKDYTAAEGGTGNTSTVGRVRFGVKFA